MVSGINSGGIPPIGVPSGQQETGDPVQPGSNTGTGDETRGVTDEIKSPSTIPDALLPLVNSTLENDEAQVLATGVGQALGGLNLSIANANPGAIPGAEG